MSEPDSLLNLGAVSVFIGSVTVEAHVMWCMTMSYGT